MSVVSHLAALSAAGLLTEAGDDYFFRHVLIRDAVYASLLRRQQRELHLAAGEVLAEQHPALPDLAPLLGHHFAAAGHEARAWPHFAEAGRAAARAYANAEAVAHFTQAIELARHSAATASELCDLYALRGRALELSLRHAEALASYAELEALARERAEPALELEGLTRRTTLHSIIGPAFDPPQAHALGSRSLALARRLGNREAEARAGWNLLLVNTYTGQTDAATEHGEAALRLARELAASAPPPPARELLAYLLTDISLHYINLDDPGRAAAALFEAQPLWRELGNLPMLAETLTRDGVIQLVTGHPAIAAQRFAEADRLCTLSHNIEGQVVALGLAPIALASTGDLGAALRTAERAISLGEISGNPLVLTGTRAELARILGWLGDVEAGLAQAALALDSAQQRLPVVAPWAQAVLAGLHLQRAQVAPDEPARGHSLAAANAIVDALPHFREVRRALAYMPPQWTRTALVTGAVRLAHGRLDEAEAVALALLDDLNRIGMVTLLPEAHLLLARIRLAQGDSAAAVFLLTQARAEAGAHGNHHTLLPLLNLMAVIAAESGRTAEAAAFRGEAAALASALAASLDDPALRARFLSRASQVTS